LILNVNVLDNLIVVSKLILTLYCLNHERNKNLYLNIFKVVISYNEWLIGKVIT